MKRFVAGGIAALLLAGSGLFFWKGSGEQAKATQVAKLVDVPSTDAVQAEAPPEDFDFSTLPQAPSVPEKNREEKRFARYDKDKNGAISSGEYLFSRRKAYDRLDRNGDGVLQFSEYATKAAIKFQKADRDRTGGLSALEFATTRAVRKSRPRPDCPPSLMRRPQSAPAQTKADADDDNDA